MSFLNREKEKLFTEINITPLTDIFLVLLIIMMVVAPSFSTMDNSVEAPEINNGLNIEEEKTTISITKDGSMYINGQSINPAQLTDQLIAVKGDIEEPEVIVKADKAVRSSVIMDVMDAAQNAEYKKLIVAGEPLSRKEERELQQRRQVEVPEDNE